ncbi:unnamed protein product [Didymodactylos carnosus]|uniref:Uncharacterized protein n=1 Tax=Didymodactylos carnosus TaxID=1234261 RepID=A0A816E520_9BILA|nr:unnamed protein product [Didymodactylos carnosus]CAF4554006.1 unnamed protein product [Didymodactylos carnosus]
MVASRGSARFTQAYNSMLGKVRHNFNLAIAEARNAPLNERLAEIRALNYALYFLPEDMQVQFKVHIDELVKLIVDEEKVHRQNLEALLTSIDEDAHAIARLGLLAEEYKKKNMPELFGTLHEQILKKLRTYEIKVQSSLDKQEIQFALSVVKGGPPI